MFITAPSLKQNMEFSYLSPKTTTSFEKLLRSQPNLSKTWSAANGFINELLDFSFLRVLEISLQSSEECNLELTRILEKSKFFTPFYLSRSSLKKLQLPKTCRRCPQILFDKRSFKNTFLGQIKINCTHKLLKRFAQHIPEDPPSSFLRPSRNNQNRIFRTTIKLERDLNKPSKIVKIFKDSKALIFNMHQLA